MIFKSSMEIEAFTYTPQEQMPHFPYVFKIIQTFRFVFQTFLNFDLDLESDAAK